jgi:membrane protein implicated in regulation of membrane protease activity
MKKIGEIAFSKRLYQAIEISGGFKLQLLIALALVIILALFGIFILLVFIQPGQEVKFLIFGLLLGGLVLLGALWAGVVCFATIKFLFSPLTFRFYEEGITINNLFVEREHVKGYMMGKSYLYSLKCCLQHR